MKCIRPTTLLFLLLALSALPTSAQPHPSAPPRVFCLFGFAQDYKGERLRDVRISVSGLTLSGTRVEHSDQSGLFCIENLPPGEFTIIAEAPGFKAPRPTPLAAGPGFRVPIVLFLSPIDNGVTFKPDINRVLQADARLRSCSCFKDLQALATTAAQAR
jgi:hypothetical protein